MRTLLLTAAALLFLAGASQAADLSVAIRDQNGRPVEDAVIIVHTTAPAPRPRFNWPLAMSQHNIAFEPHMLIVPIGGDVVFPNRDTVRHHVYSFSPTKTFELKLYGHEETRSVHFDRPGPVALGCNIHDRMSGFIYVVDTPYAARSGADGSAVIHDLPHGAATLTVWHPYMKTRDNKLDRPLAVGGDLSETVTADIRPPGGR